MDDQGREMGRGFEAASEVWFRAVRTILDLYRDRQPGHGPPTSGAWIPNEPPVNPDGHMQNARGPPPPPPPPFFYFWTLEATAILYLGVGDPGQGPAEQAQNSSPPPSPPTSPSTPEASCSTWGAENTEGITTRMADLVMEEEDDLREEETSTHPTMEPPPGFQPRDFDGPQTIPPGTLPLFSIRTARIWAPTPEDRGEGDGGN